MIVGATLALAEIEGGLMPAIEGARAALSLACGCRDSLAHTGLLATYSYALIMTCQYQKSLNSTDALTEVAEACGVDFPLHYAQLYSASACIGLRRFTVADRTLGSVERDTQDDPGSYFRDCLAIQRARLYASVGDLRRALDVLALGPAINGCQSLRGEFLGWQGLFHSALGEFEAGLDLAKEARTASRGLEAMALASTTEAIVALGTDNPSAATACISKAVATEAWDPILIAVRSVADLGRHIATHRATATWLRRILMLSSDQTLAREIGLRVPRNAKPKQTLTPRESEVHELLAQGLTNEEIARLLYISLSTTKVHVKHIYEKLGVRSRLEAARVLSEGI
jgi:DNA-binding NarL/FixJ family response regulator